MKKIFIIMGFFILCGFYLRGQTVKNIDFFMEENNEIRITYTISGVRFFQTLDISIFVSKDDGKTWTGPLKQIRGDVGPGIKSGDHVAYWSFMKELPFADEELKFKVVPKLIEEEVKRSRYISYVGNAMTYIGVRAGITGKIGYYTEIRLNALAFASGDYTYTDNAVVDYDQQGYYEFTGQKGYSAFSVNGGISYQAGKNFHLYAGLGYGWERYLFEITNYNYEGNNATGTSNVINSEHDIKGIDVNAGAMYRAGRIIFSGGLTTISFKTINWTAGLGVCF
ncbi:MAG: hypothetical protein KBC43_08345 [Bacteroidales bacterium]|nr:hypothetical protein [Bacteroidales bacterium]